MSAPTDATTDLRLRPFGEADLPAALALTQAVRWSHQAHDWRLHFALGQGLAAVDDRDVLLGTTLWWDWGGRFATLGLVLVRGDCQGRGIGRRLMQATLAQAGARAVGLVATEAGLKLYEALGFVKTGGILQCQGEVRPATASGAGGRSGPDPAATSLRHLATADHAALQGLDAAATGVHRAPLLDAVLACGLPGSVALRDGRPVGFALRRPAGRGTTVGPLVAPDEATAIALAAHALDSSAGPVRFDIPAGADALRAALESRGLGVVDRVTRMVRGAAPAIAPSARVYGLASQALG